MKVLEESAGGVEAGESISLADLGRPAGGGRATLLVFWKRL